MEWIASPEAWIALFTLTVLEIVLGIDNIIFISILVDRLPEHQQKKARLTGLALAMVLRILLLLSISWVMGLTKDLFDVAGHGFSGRDLILLFGGLFLIWKSTQEIHHSLSGNMEEEQSTTVATYGSVLAQIAVLDLVFSLDSVITNMSLHGPHNSRHSSTCNHANFSLTIRRSETPECLTGCFLNDHFIGMRLHGVDDCGDG